LGKRILIVDDDAALRKLVERALSLEGYEVETAPTGQSGLDLVHDSAPDLLLLDLMLPDINGKALYQRLRRNGYAHLPIVIFTAGLLTPEDRLALAGATVVAKPFDLDHLLCTIATMLECAPAVQ
jgi:two-component system response regulator MprA